EGDVRLGQAPDRGALEHGEVPDVGGDLRDDLHGGCAGADDPDPFAAQVLGVVPAGGVHGLPGEVVDPLDLWLTRLGEHSGRVDQVTRQDRRAVSDLDPPQMQLVVERG